MIQTTEWHLQLHYLQAWLPFEIRHSEDVSSQLDCRCQEVFLATSHFNVRPHGLSLRFACLDATVRSVASTVLLPVKLPHCKFSHVLPKFLWIWKLSSNEIKTLQRKTNFSAKFLLLCIMHLCGQRLTTYPRQLSCGQLFTVTSAHAKVQREI